MLRINLSKQQLLQSIATIGFMGSVAAGKSKTVESLTGQTTQKHKAELKDGITIKMGYSDVRIYYNGKNFLTNPKVIPEGFRLVRHYSIADNPGHNSFMPALVTGTSMVDNIVFIVSGTNGLESQTYQHFRCFKTTGIKNVAFTVSKTDLVPTEMKLREVIASIDKLMTSEDLDPEIDPPIIPMSSLSKVNFEYLLKYIVSSPYPKQIDIQEQKPFNMSILRSFDVNKPGTSLENFQGGVVGGAIKQGYLAKGDTICILPGIVKNNNGSISYTPLITQVMGMKSDITDLDVALPGGFIAIKTTLDPAFTKADGLVGNIIIKVTKDNYKQAINSVCPVIDNITVKDMTFLTETVSSLTVGKTYIIIIHGANQNGVLSSINADSTYTFELESPISVFKDDKIAVLTNEHHNLEFISYGTYRDGNIDESIECVFQEDVEDFFADLPIKEQIESIEVVDDLEQIPKFESYSEELFDIDCMIIL